MMSYPHVVEYFPIPWSRHELKREIFTSYGTAGGVNIEVYKDPNKSSGQNDLKEGNLVDFSCQAVREQSDGRYELFAQTPSVPLLPPNNYVDFNVEPCMSDVSRVLHDHKYALKELRTICSELKRKSNQLLAKDILLQAESLQSMDKVKISRQKSQYDSLNQFLRFNFGKRISGIATRSRDFLGKHLVQMNVNCDYAGGCLSYVELNEPNSSVNCVTDGVLIHPSGSRLSDVSIRDVSITGDEFLLGPADCSIALDGRLYQTAASTVYGRTFDYGPLGHRRTVHPELYLILLKVNHDGDRGNQVICKVLQSNCFIGAEKPCAVSVSPYIPGECLISTNVGSTYLWSASAPRGARKVCCESDNSTEMLCNLYRGCHFGGHPRLAVLSDRSSISLFDFRAPPGCFRDLLRLPQSFLHKDEHISVVRPHPTSSRYHFVGTDNSVMLMDERLPNYPVLFWNHLLLTPPLYMDVVCNVLPDCDDSIVLLASQESHETHCCQFRLNESTAPQRLPPQAVGPPWRTSKLQDCALFALYEGCSKGYSTMFDRLLAPLAGMCAVPFSTGHGFSVVQMTSFGDMFTQSYEAVVVDEDSKSRDRTCSAGPGCGSVKPSDSYLSAVCSWLDEAQKQLLSHTRTEPNVADDAQHTHIVDVLPYLDRQYADEIVEQPCPLCHPNSYDSSSACALEEPVCLRRCPLCNHQLGDAASIRQSHQFDFYTSAETKNVVDLPVGRDVFSHLDEQLKSIDVDRFSDCESRLLVKLWRDDYDIVEELRERDELVRKQRAELFRRGITDEVDNQVSDDDENVDWDDNSRDRDDESPEDSKFNVDQLQFASQQTPGGTLVPNTVSYSEAQATSSLLDFAQLAISTANSGVLSDKGPRRRRRQSSSSDDELQAKAKLADKSNPLPAKQDEPDDFLPFLLSLQNDSILF